MGGIGSGRPTGTGRAKVEQYHALDVNKLHRSGCLRAGWAGGWRWSTNDEQVARIDLRADVGQLVLDYKYRIVGGQCNHVVERVHIVQQPCRYGGVRPYFVCPGVTGGIACHRRVAKLFCAGSFLCRRCHCLVYASQSERIWDRKLRRTNKIRTRLGGDPGTEAIFPPRPKGMWERTYESLLYEVNQTEEHALNNYRATADIRLQLYNNRVANRS